MRRVTGIGGVFFKSRDPERLRAWYRDHLGVPIESWGGAIFPWNEPELPGREPCTIWSPFKADTTYFGPGDAPFMINYRVPDLDGLLTLLRAEGVSIDERRQDGPDGRFAWVFDPDGNRVELWELPPPSP